MLKWILAAAVVLAGCSRAPKYDVVLRNGLICDGSGSPCVAGGVAINGDTIARVGDLGADRGRKDIDVSGQVIAPGFINMMSSGGPLFADGRGLSDLLQGVTLEIFGEGNSMGPLNDTMRADQQSHQGDIKYPITWTTLAEGLDTLQRHGISPNIASFIGAATPRVYVLGRNDVTPTPAQMDQMRALVDKAMQDGALGVASALIYQPGIYSKTDELIAMAEVAAKYHGIYVSHIRNEGDQEMKAVDELIDIARTAKVPAEIYHLKIAGESNWKNYPALIAKIEAARAEGLKITADMYTYTAGATGLDASMPPWVQEGGLEKWRERLKNPAMRARVKRDMNTKSPAWDNLYLDAGSPDRIMLIGFKSEALKPYTGKTLAEVAKIRKESSEDTAMDLVEEDDSRVDTMYFVMDEDNLKKQIVLPWVSFGADAAPVGVDGVFAKSSDHPRAFGNFARVYAKYVRDEKLMPFQEAVRKMTSLPATNLGIAKRGELREGYFADVTVFDPKTIQDHATYENPKQFATGVSQVFVNGVQVVKDGAHTGALPGRVVRRAR